MTELTIAPVLKAFVETEALPGLGLEAGAFWDGFAALVGRLAPRNRALLETRDALQARIDAWHRAHPGRPIDAAAYTEFLRGIGYLLPPAETFGVTTADVDDEIAVIAGPQLVVPVSNARYALNAGNARWGSLYDALYGTDAIPDAGAPRGGGFNPVRGKRVVARARAFLDQSAPLAHGGWADAQGLSVESGTLWVKLPSGMTGLAQPAKFAGYRGEAADPSAILLRNHRLHVELVIDRGHAIGRDDPAGLADVLMESAVSTIMDCEDSIAAVDAEDKVAVYRNWLGLMKGIACRRVVREERPQVLQPRDERRTAPTRAPKGGDVARCTAAALMLIRNDGAPHLYTDAVLDGRRPRDPRDDPARRPRLTSTDRDAMTCTRGAGAAQQPFTGSIYIVKPKMHGPDEIRVRQRGVRPRSRS